MAMILIPARHPVAHPVAAVPAHRAQAALPVAQAHPAPVRHRVAVPAHPVAPAAAHRAVALHRVRAALHPAAAHHPAVHPVPMDQTGRVAAEFWDSPTADWFSIRQAAVKMTLPEVMILTILTTAAAHHRAAALPVAPAHPAPVRHRAAVPVHPVVHRAAVPVRRAAALPAVLIPHRAAAPAALPVHRAAAHHPAPEGIPPALGRLLKMKDLCWQSSMALIMMHPPADSLIWELAVSMRPDAASRTGSRKGICTSIWKAVALE